MINLICRARIFRRKGNCLADDAGPSYATMVVKPYLTIPPGQLEDVHTQCRQLYGNESFMCVSNSLSLTFYKDKIIIVIWILTTIFTATSHNWRNVLQNVLFWPRKENVYNRKWTKSRHGNFMWRQKSRGQKKYMYITIQK